MQWIMKILRNKITELSTFTPAKVFLFWNKTSLFSQGLLLKNCQIIVLRHILRTCLGTSMIFWYILRKIFMLFKLEDFFQFLNILFRSVEMQLRFTRTNEKSCETFRINLLQYFANLVKLKVVINFVSDRFLSSGQHEN